MKTPAKVLTLLAALTALPLHAQQVAYTGATVWDGSGTPAIPGATLVVEGGRVVSLSTDPPPAGATVVRLDGRWIIPGLVDSHVHVSGRWAPEGVTDPGQRVVEELRLWARYGVTTVNSLGDEPADAFRLRGDALDGPVRARVMVAGPVIAATTEAAARTAVDANADAGVDWMKIRVDDNLGTTAKMPWDAVHGVLDQSDRRGFRTATHLFYQDDAKRLLRDGSDLVAHSVRDGDLDTETLALLRERGVCTVPTLTRELSTFVYAQRPDWFDDPFFTRWAHPGEVARVSEPAFRDAMAASPAAARYRVALGQAQRNLKALVDAGLPVAFGTDAGPAGRFPGYFEHLELSLMVEAGLTPAQALYTAAGGAADCLRLDDVGVLAPGRWADFLVLDADPLADVANARALNQVYVGGRPVSSSIPTSLWQGCDPGTELPSRSYACSAPKRRSSQVSRCRC